MIPPEEEIMTKDDAPERDDEAQSERTPPSQERAPRSAIDHYRKELERRRSRERDELSVLLAEAKREYERSEERRVGKECRYRRWSCSKKKNNKDGIR